MAVTLIFLEEFESKGFRFHSTSTQMSGEEGKESFLLYDRSRNWFANIVLVSAPFVQKEISSSLFSTHMRRTTIILILNNALFL